MRYRAIHPSHGWLDKHWYVGKISPDTKEKPPVSKVRGDLFEPLSEFEAQLVDAKESGKVGQTYFSIDQQRLQMPKVGVNYKPEDKKPESENEGQIKKAKGVGKWILPDGKEFKGSKAEAEKHWAEKSTPPADPPAEPPTK